MRVSQNPLDILCGKSVLSGVCPGRSRTAGVTYETTLEPRICVACRVNLANARWSRRHCQRTNTAASVSVKGLLKGHYVLQQYSKRDLSRDSGGDSES